MEGEKPSAPPLPGDQIHVDGAQNFHDTNKVDGTQTGHIGGNANTIVGQIHNTITLTAEVVKHMTEQARNLDTRRSDIRSCRHKINQVKASIDRTSGIFSSISKFLSTVNTDKEDLTNGVQKFQVQVTEYEQMLSSYTEKVAQFDPEINNPEDFGEELDLMKLEVGFRRKQLKVDLKLFEMSIKFDRIESAPEDAINNILKLWQSVYQGKMTFQTMRYNTSSNQAGNQSGYSPEHHIPPYRLASPPRDRPGPHRMTQTRQFQPNQRFRTQSAQTRQRSLGSSRLSRLSEGDVQYVEDTQNEQQPRSWQDYDQRSSPIVQKLPFEPTFVCWSLSAADPPKSTSKGTWKHYNSELLHIGSDELFSEITSRTKNREKEILRQYNKIESRRQRRAIDALLVEQDASLKMQDTRMRWVLASLKFKTEKYGPFLWRKSTTVGMMVILKTELVPPHGSHCICDLCRPTAQRGFAQGRTWRIPTVDQNTESASNAAGPASPPSRIRMGPQQRTPLPSTDATALKLPPKSHVPLSTKLHNVGASLVRPYQKDIPAQSMRTEPPHQQSNQKHDSVSMKEKKPERENKKKRTSSSEHSSPSESGRAEKSGGPNIHIHVHTRGKGRPTTRSSSSSSLSIPVSSGDSTRAIRHYRSGRMRDTSSRVHLGAKSASSGMAHPVTHTRYHSARVDDYEGSSSEDSSSSTPIYPRASRFQRDVRTRNQSMNEPYRQHRPNITTHPDPQSIFDHISMDANNHSRRRMQSWVSSPTPEDLRRNTSSRPDPVAVHDQSTNRFHDLSRQQPPQSWKIPEVPMIPRPGWRSPRLDSLDIQIPPSKAMVPLRPLQPQLLSAYPQNNLQPSHNQNISSTTMPHMYNPFNPSNWRFPSPRTIRERERSVSYAPPSIPHHPSSAPPLGISTRDYPQQRPHPIRGSTTFVPPPPHRQSTSIPPPPPPPSFPGPIMDYSKRRPSTSTHVPPRRLNSHTSSSIPHVHMTPRVPSSSIPVPRSVSNSLPQRSVSETARNPKKPRKHVHSLVDGNDYEHSEDEESFQSEQISSGVTVTEDDEDDDEEWYYVDEIVPSKLEPSDSDSLTSGVKGQRVTLAQGVEDETVKPTTTNPTQFRTGSQDRPQKRVTIRNSPTVHEYPANNYPPPTHRPRRPQPVVAALPDDPFTHYDHNLFSPPSRPHRHPEVGFSSLDHDHGISPPQLRPQARRATSGLASANYDYGPPAPQSRPQSFRAGSPGIPYMNHEYGTGSEQRRRHSIHAARPARQQDQWNGSDHLLAPYRSPLPPSDPKYMTEEEKKKTMSSLIAAFRPAVGETRRQPVA